MGDLIGHAKARCDFRVERHMWRDSHLLQGLDEIGVVIALVSTQGDLAFRIEKPRVLRWPIELSQAVTA